MQRTMIVTTLVAGLTLAGVQSDALDAPVALEADGAIIDMGEAIGHAGPLLRDHDGDGRTDLLVSSFRGTIELFRNLGTNTEPRYESQGVLKTADGKDLKFHNW